MTNSVPTPAAFLENGLTNKAPRNITKAKIYVTRCSLSLDFNDSGIISLEVLGETPNITQLYGKLRELLAEAMGLQGGEK